MANHETHPVSETKPAPKPAPEPPPAPAPTVTPLDAPVPYYNKKWRVPPLVVDTQEEADALDPLEWHVGPPLKDPPVKASEPQFPKLYYNVNVAPKIVADAAEARALGDDWKEFALPAELLAAGKAKLDKK